MNVLLIGGTQFIGPAVVRRLVASGHRVAVFHRGQTQADLPSGVEPILGDRHDLGKHAAGFRRFAPEVVVDMIAYTEADAVGLVETFRGLARRAIVISSGDVYRAYGRFIRLEEAPIEPTPLAEASPLRQVLFPYRKQAKDPDDFAYSYDKIPVERVLLGDRDLPGTALRLPMVYGPGDPFRRLSPYLKCMDDSRPAIVLHEGLAHWKCPRGHVENVAAAIALAVADKRAAGRVYNIAEPVAYGEAEWVRKIGEAAGWRGEISAAPRGRIPVPFDTDQNIDTDTTAIRSELGYVEVVPPGEALAQTIAWERANPAEASSGFGLVDYETEDVILREMGRGLDELKGQVPCAS